MGRQAVSSSFALCMRPLAHITSYRAWSIDARAVRPRNTFEGDKARDWLLTARCSLGHAASFILFTVTLSPRSAGLTSVCGFWWLAATLLKIGEHSVLAPRIAAPSPIGFSVRPYSKTARATSRVEPSTLLISSRSRSERLQRT